MLPVWLGIKATSNFAKAAKGRKIQKQELKSQKRELQAQQRTLAREQPKQIEQLASDVGAAGVAGSPAAAERVATLRARQNDENTAITRGLQKIKRRKKAGRLDISSIL